jgi:protein required for attachment to host cells
MCKATSINDIIRSINDSKKKDKSFFSNKNNKLKEQEFSKLNNFGINEVFMCKENPLFKNVIDSYIGKDNTVYTSLDYDSIETAIILFNKDTNIYPLLNISDDNKIKDQIELDIFKEKFGFYGKKNNSIHNKIMEITGEINKRLGRENDEFKKLYTEEEIKKNLSKKLPFSKSLINNYIALKSEYYNVTKLNKFWSTKNINNKFFNIKDLTSSICWKYIFGKKLSSYRFDDFQKTLKKLILNSSDDTKSIIIICHPNLIVAMLKLLYKKLYKKDIKEKDIIVEYTSLWEISFDIKNKGKDTDIEYQGYKKIYPIEYNHKPLKTIDGGKTFTYKYDNNTFMLFNSLESIPPKYIENIEVNSMGASNRKVLKGNKNNTNTTKHGRTSFEDLINL